MDSKTFIIAFISFIVGVSGYALFSPQFKAPASTNTDEHAGHMMDHKSIQVDADKPLPTVSILAHKDSMSGFNIHVTTEHYTFTPEKAGEASIQGEGHAHVYVNGIKVMRLYGPWAHIPGDAFKDGENTIQVTLNGNDHSDWVIGDKHIEATTVVTK